MCDMRVADEDLRFQSKTIMEGFRSVPNLAPNLFDFNLISTE